MKSSNSTSSSWLVGIRSQFRFDFGSQKQLLSILAQFTKKNINFVGFVLTPHNLTFSPGVDNPNDLETKRQAKQSKKLLKKLNICFHEDPILHLNSGSILIQGIPHPGVHNKLILALNLSGFKVERSYVGSDRTLFFEISPKDMKSLKLGLKVLHQTAEQENQISASRSVL